MGTVLTPRREGVSLQSMDMLNCSPCNEVIVARDMLVSADKDKALVPVVMVILQECMRVLRGLL